MTDMHTDLPKTINEALKILAYNDYFWVNSAHLGSTAQIHPHHKDKETVRSLAEAQYVWTEKQGKLEEEIAEIMKEVVGFKGNLTFDIQKPDGSPRKLIDVSRLTKMGWKYSIDLEEGLKKTYKWYLTRGDK